MTTEETQLLAAENRRRQRAAEMRNDLPATDPLQGAINRLMEYAKANPVNILDHRNDARASDIALLRAHWGAPARHLETTINEECKPWCEMLLRLTTRIGTGFMVALVGPRGPGKTQMGVELMKIATGQLRSARYCTAMDFFVDMKCSFEKARSEASQKEILHEYARPKLLVIDEAQERGETAWEDRLLTHLVNRRYNDKKDTLFISNQNTKDFLASIGPSIASRMSETGAVITCDWPSFRDKKP